MMPGMQGDSGEAVRALKQAVTGLKNLPRMQDNSGKVNDCREGKGTGQNVLKRNELGVTGTALK